MWMSRDYRIFLPVMLGIVALAWLSLVVWGQSPYARYLHHDGLAEVKFGLGSTLLVVFVGGWTLMTIAMMLPTSLPLITLFRRMTVARPDRNLIIGLLIAGYLVVWTAFGVLAHLVDLGIHQVLGQATVLNRHAWVIGSGVLLVAGIYQFTPLKYHCLDTCRSPRTFIAGRWQGRNERRQSLLLGLQHGVFCVGCCWTLMLVLFLVGAGSIVWMLLLGGVMAIEKNLSWGRQLSAPLGLSLISASVAISLLAVV
jgi:predicted metal-binding membrane protein